jgi:hypothetical protein
VQPGTFEEWSRAVARTCKLTFPDTGKLICRERQ